MGRGRAKAKQTKVARELKYNTPQTDFDALRAELAGSSSTKGRTSSPSRDDDDSDPRSEDDDYGSNRR